MQLGAGKSAKQSELIDSLGGGTDLKDYVSPFAQPTAPEPEPVRAVSPAAVTSQVKENPFGAVDSEM